MTPEQMRALADEGDERALDILTRSPGAVHKLTAALRAAANEAERIDVVIGSASHDRYCGLERAQQRTDYCNCWKAEV